MANNKKEASADGVCSLKGIHRQYLLRQGTK